MQCREPCAIPTFLRQRVMELSKIKYHISFRITLMTAMVLLITRPTRQSSRYQCLPSAPKVEPQYWKPLPNHTVNSAIWIGTNDLGPSAFFTDNRSNLTISDYVDCVYEQLDTLYDIGARNFVLLNLAPLNHAPIYALPQDGGTIDSQYWLNEDQYTNNVYVSIPTCTFFFYPASRGPHRRANGLGKFRQILLYSTRS